MKDIIFMLFTESFLLRALIAGVMISLCSALLGVSLVLKKFSMIGDGLSHVGFGAMAIAVAANVAPLTVALPVVIVASFLLIRLNEKAKIKGDVAIALLSTGALAVGVMATSMTTGMNVDIYNYMFGSIYAMNGEDVVLSLILSLLVLALFLLFYHRIFAVTFDEDFSRAVGTRVEAYNLLIAVVVAVIIVLAMNLVGSLLISALIIFPALSAMRLFRSFRGVTICSAVLSVVCALTGMLISIVGGTPVGSTIVAVDIVAFFVFGINHTTDNFTKIFIIVN